MTEIYYEESDVVEKIKYYLENKNTENLNNLAEYSCDLLFEDDDEEQRFLDVCEREFGDENILEFLLTLLKVQLR